MPASAERSRQLRRRLGGSLAALLVLGLGAGFTGPGVYRVEADRHVGLFPIGGGAGYRPWIFSNPVHVRE
jgi:hypothetical protein